MRSEAPSPAARDFPGGLGSRGSCSHANALNCRGGGGSRPRTSHWGVMGQDPEWVALKSPMFPRKESGGHGGERG